MATTRYELRTFDDIVAAVREELGIQATDTVTINRIKRDINVVYLNEVIPASRWKWLRRNLDREVETKFNTGTASVTQDSTAVTLSETPTQSYKGYWFSVDGDNEIHRIRDHVENTSAITLETRYNGATNTTRSFRIWTDAVPLPADCKEVIDVRHDYSNVPLENRGLQEYRQIMATKPKLEARPRYYTTGEYRDVEPYEVISGLPVSATRTSDGLLKSIKFASTLGADSTSLLLQIGDHVQVAGAGHSSYNSEVVIANIATTDNTNDTIQFVGKRLKDESGVADTGISVTKRTTRKIGEKYRELLIHPAIYPSRTVLHIDYVREVAPLTEGTDEPVIPLEDRIILLYGALSRSWVKQRDPETSAYNATLYAAKLGTMKGKTEDTPDMGQLRPSKLYMSRKRSMRGARTSPLHGEAEFGTSAISATGSPNRAAEFDDRGQLVSSSITTTELGYLQGTNDNIQDQLDALGLSGVQDGNRVVQTSSIGAIEESDITSTELTYLDDVTPLTSKTLTDATADEVITTVVSMDFDALIIEYSIKRDTARETGQIMIAHDNSSIAEAQTTSTIGTTGVTFSYSFNGDDLEWKSTTTSTGNNADLKYKIRKWQM